MNIFKKGIDMKKALITGITGQDGSYLAELLLERGYRVYGVMRRKSKADYGNVGHIKDKIQFIYADMTDMASLIKAVDLAQPDEVYNLAAQSFVAPSWDQPVATAEINAVGVTNILEAIKLIKKDAHFYQASTSEMFGLVGGVMPKKRIRHFIQEAHMGSLNYMDIGLPKITVKVLGCLRAVAYCLTMKVKGGERSLLQGK